MIAATMPVRSLTRQKSEDPQPLHFEASLSCSAASRNISDLYCTLGNSLLQQEISHHHGVDSRRVKAPHGVARHANQRFAKEVERCVVKHRQSGLMPEGMQ